MLERGEIESVKLFQVYVVREVLTTYYYYYCYFMFARSSQRE